MEANTAYTWEKGRFLGFVGGGPSIHYFKLSGFQSNSAYQVYDSSDFSGDPSNTTVVSQQQEFNGQNAKLKYGYGGQAFVGAAVELGKAPYIGGRWGVVASARYQYVKETEIEYDTKWKAEEFYLNGTDFDSGNMNLEDKGTFTLNPKSFGARLGLVFFM
jgi:hypothetical protein